jgi:hypothetical protein
MPNTRDLPVEEVKKRFYLDGSVLRWACRSGGTGKFRKGDLVKGSRSSAGYFYLSITIDSIKYHPKRAWVVWVLTTGSWPNGVIDHIDGNTENDSPTNLRDVSHSQNLRNTELQRIGHPIGVQYNPRYKKPWGVQFGINGKTEYFGRFATEREAAIRAEEVRATLL